MRIKHSQHNQTEKCDAETHNTAKQINKPQVARMTTNTDVC